MRVVRRYLIIPDEFAGMDIEYYHRAGIEIGARPAIAVEARRRVGDGYEQQPFHNVRGQCTPSGAAAVVARRVIRPAIGPGLSVIGNGVEAPDRLAGRESI